MLYEKYYRKTLKWSSILTVIHRFRVLIICALLAVIAMIAAFMALFGMVYSSGECPSEITYGESLDYEAKSLFTRVSYEYCSSDGEWTASFPRQVGEYSVRSVSKNIFGSPRYGEVYSFAILPKETEVYVGVSSVEYGEMPAVMADLAYEDSLQCTSVIYDDVTKTSTGVIPDKSCVAIINKSGSDVTSNYNITCVKTDISFTRRTLTVEVEGAEKVYDGMALTCSSYSITGGTLADGDSITAEVNSSITDVGSTENSLVFTVVNKNGKDVTSHYYIQVNAGMLTVTQRTLYITTGDYTYTYDGTEHSYQNYEAQSGVTDEGLLVTHKLSVTELTYATDAGTYENIIGFTITDRSGNDVTSNYNMVCTYGTLTVAQREITVTTGTSQKVYDGTPLYNTDYTLTYGSIANGQAADIVYYAEQTDAGSTENVVTLSISSGQSDVTANYLITYINGTLTVTQRQVTVITGSAEKVYDATPLACEDCSCTNIAEGQTAHIASQSSITDVGSVQNITNTAYITDENGNDVTANYIITYEYGTLTVTPRPVTVVAGSSYKVYDATPLTCTEIGYYNLVSWHTATAQTYGSQT
ncbi:MAG: hypothetical protein LUD19_00120, partial [Clostridia bacterium]|nr:hypothetical protein [Clostridia bacterium]